jgi:hypothetical protein
MHNLVLSPISLPELEALIKQSVRTVLNETVAVQQAEQKEFLTEPEARELLGNISKALFHKLKREGKYSTYHCGEGRCLYSREELISYIRNNNKPANK